MPTPKIYIAPERIAEAKQLYELTLTPVPDIAVMMGVSRRTLERWILEWNWTPRSVPRLPTDRALVATAPVAAANPAPAIADANEAEMRSANAARIQDLVAQTLDGVQRVLDKAGPADEGGAEHSARTLAAVGRTLEEMSALTKPDEVTLPHETEDDAIPLDLDELRFELARRLHALIDARTGDEGRDCDGVAAGAGTEASRGP